MDLIHRQYKPLYGCCFLDSMQVVKEGHRMLMEEGETESLIFFLFFPLMDSRMELFITGQKAS